LLLTAVEISSSVLESTAACASPIKNLEIRHQGGLSGDDNNNRNYCWSAGILSTRWSSGIRRTCNLCDLRLPPTILTSSVCFDRSEYRSFSKEEFEVGPLILFHWATE
jgi:hypothetical protein